MYVPRSLCLKFPSFVAELSKQLVAPPRSRRLAGLRNRRGDQLLRRCCHSDARRGLLPGEGAELAVVDGVGSPAGSGRRGGQLRREGARDAAAPAMGSVSHLRSSEKESEEKEAEPDSVRSSR